MDIAVIGSGIGGLASSIFLARQGHQITVYEQADSPRPVGAGFLLQPPGQRVLGKLGVNTAVSKFINQFIRPKIPIGNNISGKPIIH